MRVDRIQVKNFRSFEDQSISCDRLTVLVGANGAGKSTLLKAIDLFYETAPKIEEEDFHNNNTLDEMVIALTFSDLSDEEISQFDLYVENDQLTVEKVVRWESGKAIVKLHGASLQNPDFAPIRRAQSVSERRSLYKQLRGNSDYGNLPAWTKQDDALEHLLAWERDNAHRCIRLRDDGQFFGFKEVARGYLGRWTRFLLIPAVREASDDATEGRGMALTNLMDMVVRSAVADKEPVKRLKETTEREYREILDPAKLTELSTLARSLTETLETFVPNARVELNWQDLPGIEIPMPRADVKLNEDGYSSSVARAGHGLQRAFILTMLQHLAVAQEPSPSAVPTGGDGKSLPDLILAIEEPELYQHPNRQRHLAAILMKLASGQTPGVARSTQVIYCTHSPLFVGIDRLNQIRLFRKIRGEPRKPRRTQVVSADLNAIAEEIWHAGGSNGERYTGKTLLPRLQAIMNPWMNEGFFADVAVLVEGEDDRAAVLGAARASNIDLESQGISVIPCNGKNSLDRPAVIFRRLGIEVYVIWDGDRGEPEADPKDNHRLLRLMSQTVTDWPSSISEHFACFECKLEKTLRSELGQEWFDSSLCKCMSELGIKKRKSALKSPAVYSRLFEFAKKDGQKSETMECIVDRVLSLRAKQRN